MNRKRLLKIAGLALVPLAVGAWALQGQAARADGSRLFAQVLRYVEQFAVDSLDNEEIFEKAARGLVKNLNDPYADLYSPEQLASFQRNTLGNNYGGVGMQIQSQDGLITVTAVFPGTPSERAGIVTGDRIITVDTAAVTGMRIDEVSSRLTGPAGTRVNATFARAGVTEPIAVTFTRAIIKVPAVPYTLILENGVGYVPLQRFNEVSASHVEEAVRQLRSQGATSYIIDVRGNPGGSLDQSLEISNLFLRPGVEIASVRHRGREPEIFRANRPSIVDSARIVVLIDNLSASASEIVSGSLQDHDRALVIGQTSFGKGLVQTLYPLEGGWAIKLTTGKWYTPSGRSIQGEHRQLADGRFVEWAPDSLETDSTKAERPQFRSSGGRIVFGGGGIAPDVLVRQDTLTTAEQEFMSALGPQWPAVYNTIYGYAIDLKGRVRSDFVVGPEMVDEFYRRLEAADVRVSPELRAKGGELMARYIDLRVAGLAFGDSAAFRRAVPEDRQLQTALDFLRRGATQRDLLALAAEKAESPGG